MHKKPNVISHHHSIIKIDDKNIHNLLTVCYEAHCGAMFDGKCNCNRENSKAKVLQSMGTFYCGIVTGMVFLIALSNCIAKLW